MNNKGIVTLNKYLNVDSKRTKTSSVKINDGNDHIITVSREKTPPTTHNNGKIECSSCETDKVVSKESPCYSCLPCQYNLCTDCYTDLVKKYKYISNLDLKYNESIVNQYLSAEWTSLRPHEEWLPTPGKAEAT